MIPRIAFLPGTGGGIFRLPKWVMACWAYGKPFRSICRASQGSKNVLKGDHYPLTSLQPKPEVGFNFIFTFFRCLGALQRCPQEPRACSSKRKTSTPIISNSGVLGIVLLPLPCPCTHLLWFSNSWGVWDPSFWGFSCEMSLWGLCVG